MKRKEIKELQQKTLPELKKLLKEKRESLLKSKMDVQSRKTKNVRSIARMRDDLARIMTFINQKTWEETSK